MAHYTAAMERGLQRHRALILKLYDVLNVGERTTTGRNQLAPLLGVNPNVVTDLSQELRGLGILQVEIYYPKSNGGERVGRQADWTLLVPREEAIRRYEAYIESLRNGGERVSEKFEHHQRPRKVTPETPKPKMNGEAKEPPVDRTAIRTERDEPVEAIAGPDRPSPFLGLAGLRRDEEAALIEAARQYRNRASTVESKIGEMEQLAKSVGATFDAELIRSAFRFDRDERLEAIGLVMSYIDRLETRVETLTRLNAEAADQIKNMRTKVNDYDRMKRENDRLVSMNAGLRAQISNSPAA